MKRATILLIDQTEQNDLKARLDKATGFTVIGSTNNVDIGFTMAEKHQPEVILLNVDLSGSDDKVAEVFALEFPASSLILMTRSDSKRVLRQALRVGAKDVINLPIDDDKLFRLIGRVVQQEMKRRDVFTVEKKERPQFKTITVFSTKGGVGKSTVALNLAIAINKLTKKRTVLVDLNLMSGNIALMAGVVWKRSIKDLIDEINNLDQEMIDNYCAEHPSGLKILPAPAYPEVASFIKAEHVEKIIDYLSQTFNYVIIDAPNYFHDTVIPALDHAKDIVLVTTLDLASIQNLKQCLDLLAGLNIRSKARIVVNRMGYSGGLKVKDLEDELNMAVQTVIPACDKLAINAVNMGVPFLISEKSSPAERPLMELAAKLMTEDDQPKSTPRRGILGIR